MDWKKIKTQLLIILLILNLFLLASYILKYERAEPYKISKQSLGRLLGQLEYKGIELTTKFPKTPQNLHPLIVKYQEKKPGLLNDDFFDGQGRIETENEVMRLSYGHEEITIINNRRFIYDNLTPSTSSPNLDSEELVKNFLIDKGFSVGDMVLSKKIRRENGEFLEFVKTHKGRTIETSYTRFEVEDGVIRMMDRLWIDVIEEDGQTIDIEPSYKAVLSLMSEEDYYNSQIKAINICYYFNPEEQGVLEDNTRAVRGRAIPAWRIAFADGKSKVIDNY